MKIIWTVFEKFEILMKGREKKKQKNDTIALVENFFRLLKKLNMRTHDIKGWLLEINFTLFILKSAPRLKLKKRKVSKISSGFFQCKSSIL